MKIHKKWFFLFLSWVTLMIANGSAAAQEFRVESEIFNGSDKAPVSENLTIFSDGIVYDFRLSEPKETVIHDSFRGKFVLLKPDRKIKVNMEQSQVNNALEQLRQSPVFKKRAPYLVNPEFAFQQDKESGWMELSSKNITYKVKGKEPKVANGFRAYIDFANWYVKLNALDPRKMPPFARLQMNRVLSTQNIIPSDVELTIRPENAKPIKARSKHYVIWQLSQTDRRRIDTAKKQWVEFKEVSLQEFQTSSTIAAVRAQPANANLK